MGACVVCVCSVLRLMCCVVCACWMLLCVFAVLCGVVVFVIAIVLASVIGV